MEGHASLTLVLALAAGVVGQSVARHVRVPGIVILLALGLLLGPDILGWIEPHSLGDGLFLIVELAVAVILFEGGLNLEISRLLRSQTPIRRLVTWGALITGVGAALATYGLLDWSRLNSALFGSLVVVTGPTVIGPLVSELRLRPRVATVLEAEGVLIDPIGAILAVLVLRIALAPTADTLASGALDLVLKLIFGGLCGVAGGFALAFLLRVRRLVPDGFENIVALAAVLLLYVGCDTIVSHSGILAVPIAGVVVGNLRTRVDRDLREFKDQLTILLIGMLFVLLAADVRLADVQALGTRGLMVLAVLVVVVRPLNVFVCTAGSELSLRERALLAWLAPRGIVAAAIASLTSSALDNEGVPGGSELRALVFVTIAGTVLLAGFTGLPVAALLGVRLPGRDRVGILGVQGLGLVLARQLRAAGSTVVFLDSNPHNCRRAEEEDFLVVFGNGLQERTLERARFDLVRIAVGMTRNDALNNQFASVTGELFKVPSTLVALRRADGEPEGESEALFLSPHDLERWDVRVRRNEVEVESWTYRGITEVEGDSTASPSPTSLGEHAALVLLQRGKQARPVDRSYRPRSGDVVSVAVYVPDREQAHSTLTSLGWTPEVPEGDGP